MSAILDYYMSNWTPDAVLKATQLYDEARYVKDDRWIASSY